MANNTAIIAPYSEQYDLLSVLSGKMKKPNGLSLKKIVLYLDGNSLSLQRVGPANSDELNEMRMLEKRGLVKFMVVDVSSSFLAHKYAQHKLLYDLSNGNSVFTQIVDRTQQGHDLVQIQASQIWLRKLSLTPAQFQQLVREEDEMLKNYEKS